MIARAIAIFGFVVLVTSSPANADWPQWRGPHSDGSWPTAPAVGAFPDDRLPTLWTQKIGPGYSGISVTGGRVFTQDRPAQPADSERVVCLDAVSGELVWEHRYKAEYGKLSYGKGPRATPTVRDGRVYALGAVGHLFCLDAKSGDVIWSKDLVKDYNAQQPTWGFSASPVCYQQAVIIHCGLPRGCYVAFDGANGAEVWRSGNDPTGYGTPVLFRHADRVLMLGWTPEHIVCVDPDSGRELWKVPYKVTYGVSIATPVVRNDIALVCGYWEGSKAIRLGAQIGKADLLWEENRYLRGLMAQPLFRDGYVYLLDKSQGIVCFEISKGEMIWNDKNQLTPRGRNPQATMVWLGESGEALVLNSSGELIRVRFSPEGFEELDRAKLLGETWAHPAYANGNVYARDDKQLVCGRVCRAGSVSPQESGNAAD